MYYNPAKKTASGKHSLPKWYDDAKFGIFIHWGLFSVPAWAKADGKSLADLSSAGEGFKASLRNMPYAEWYLNTSRIEGSATSRHHAETYGKDFSYFDFQKEFEEKSKNVDFEQWTDLFKAAGAKYVVLVTKHHDGYCLWPSQYRNPQMNQYQSSRDIVGEITESVRRKGMKMGLYYSGIFDWTFKKNAIDGFDNWIDHHLPTDAYCDYATKQTYELINKYHPSILWNDIGFPPQADLDKLFADYYAAVPDGVINDRWRQYVADPAKTKEEQFAQWNDMLEKQMSAGGIVAILHGDKDYDFETPEYEPNLSFKEHKFELTRGMSMSFGYNQLDDPSTTLTYPQIVRMIVDVVSKNGNLLLNVGPRADGTIPEEQIKPLLATGKWLEKNGEAIYGTRCWEYQQGKTTQDQPVRFTAKEDALYISVMADTLGETVEIEDLQLPAGAQVQLLGCGRYLSWEQKDHNLLIHVPAGIEEEPVYVFKVIS